MVSEISKIQSATQFLISPSSNEFDVATVPKKLKLLSDFVPNVFIAGEEILKIRIERIDVIQGKVLR